VRPDGPRSYPSVPSCELALMENGWRRVEGTAWFNHPKQPARLANVVPHGKYWRTNFQGPIVQESFRRYVLTAQQQLTLCCVLQQTLTALKIEDRRTEGTDHNAPIAEQRLKVGELLPIFAEGGEECDDEGNEL